MISETVKQLTLKYIEAGCSSQELAELFQIPVQRMRARLGRWGMRPQKRMSPDYTERNQRMCEQYLAGKTLAQVAEPYGLTRERVRQILVRNGIAERYTWLREKKKSLRVTAEQLMPLYLAGRTFPEACKQLGVKYTSELRAHAPTIKPYQHRLHKVARFWSQTKRNDHPHPALGTPCWMWIGVTRKTTGYGHTGLFKEYATSAHKVAYCLTKGMPKNWVLHRCDIPACVNPEHLYDGTPKENCADRDKNGPRGRVLTFDNAKDIRSRLERGESIQDVAKFYNVSGTTIYNIQKNRAHTGNKKKNQVSSDDIRLIYSYKGKMSVKDAVAILPAGECVIRDIWNGTRGHHITGLPQRMRGQKTGILLTFNNETHNLATWARKLGITPAALKGRLKKWPLEKAMQAKVERESKYTEADIAMWFRLKQTMTLKEVARCMGVPYGAVNSYLYKLKYQHLKPTSGTTDSGD